jgi:hypothetical protein
VERLKYFYWYERKTIQLKTFRLILAEIAGGSGWSTHPTASYVTRAKCQSWEMECQVSRGELQQMITVMDLITGFDHFAGSKIQK